MKDRQLQFLFPAAALVLVVLIFAVINLFDAATPLSPLERGVLWIANRQRDDGSWRGEEVAVLRPGPAMTALVVYAMCRLPEPIRARLDGRLKHAVRYLQSNIDATGIVGMGPAGPDYPNYATALTVLSFVALKPVQGEPSVARMVDSLKRAQLDETEGWRREDPEYGGWAFGGVPQAKPTAHRLDISITRFVLEALSAAGVPPDDPVWDRARLFLERCRNQDGGFHFTTLPDQEKAGGLSYGTATADGLLAMRAAGGAKEDIEAATKWIDERFTAERCPGFPADHPRPWADGLLGYWLASVSRVSSKEDRSEIERVLTSCQRPDGSWMNPSDLMLENEPMLATALALIALSDADDDLR